MRKVLMFDSTLKCRSGKRIPWVDEQIYGNDDDGDIIDNSLHWFHISYGTFRLYRLHQVDKTEYYICEPLNKWCRTYDPEWEAWRENPELAVRG